MGSGDAFGMAVGSRRARVSCMRGHTGALRSGAEPESGMSCRVLCPQLAVSVAACTARVLVPPDPCPVSPRARVGVGVRGRPWARSQGEHKPRRAL